MIIDDHTKEEIRNIVREMFTEEDQEIAEKKDAVVSALAKSMDLIALRHLAVKEAASLIECYAMGNTDGMIHEFWELKMAICAVMKHLPEFQPEMEKKKAVDGYYKMYVKD